MEEVVSPRKKARKKVTLYVNGMALHNLLPPLSDSAFIAFCVGHPKLKIEQDKHGNITIMPPVSYESGKFESTIIGELYLWNRTHKLGQTFSSQTMFLLPNGEKRMPDAAWVDNSKDIALTKAEKQTFARVVPNFVIELVSPSDSLSVVRQKMREIWIANGVQLAWLLDPANQVFHVFRADGTETIVTGLEQVLSGEQVLPDFTFDLRLFAV